MVPDNKLEDFVRRVRDAAGANIESVILFGEDVVQGLRISMRLHRMQVEYELREKLILLRQQVLLASGNDSRLWDLLLRSVPSFGTLFRHALIALGDASQSGRREAIHALAKRLGFDP